MTKNRTNAFSLLASLLLCLAVNAAQASNLDTIGVTLLRAVTTNLNGAGIRAGHAEAQLNPPPNGAWEVNPGQTSPAVNLPTNDFSYYSNGVANSYPNGLGVESSHADGVASYYYGLPGGVATNVTHIDMYEADYFVGVTVPSLLAINDKIVNQSFTGDITGQSYFNTNYDNYAAHFGTLFVSGVGDGGGLPVSPPATCYNDIGVGAYGTTASSIGPTTDNGRSKPDITAPGDSTSDSCPLVAGAAVILLQAALRGDGGSATNSAADLRTLKALLLNGALKPSDWTNGSTTPLDQRYGAGVLNIYESYEQLVGGQHAYIASSVVPVNGAHPPTSSVNNLSSLVGWDFNTNTSGNTNDTVNHYYFNVTNSNASSAAFTATATLAWNRQQNKVGVNELDLYLYNTANTNLVTWCSNSMDNVKHLFITQLPPGRYDLQVLKKGGAGTNFLSGAETYALAFEFFNVSLGCSYSSGGNVVLTWPVYPAGFNLVYAYNLNPPANWAGVGATPVISNNMNYVTLSATSGNRFFRLMRP